MASYNELNALIDAYINRNGVQAITGQILNGVLKAMVEQLGRGYTIMGAAIPTTDPGTPDGPECYFASNPGTYTDFDGLQVVPGELALLCYTPSDGWTKATIYEGFQEVGATIDGNVGTPSVGVSYADGVLSFDFHNMKGNPGDPAGFGTIGADITGGVGTPGVTVESSGPATAKNLQFHFTNLKGETGVTSVVATVDNTTGTPACTVSLVGQQLTLAFSGLKGAQGDTGSSVDYPFTIVNNLTTDDATQALSAAQGVVLDGKVSQLEAEVTDLDGEINGATVEEFIQKDLSTQGVRIASTGATSSTGASTYAIDCFPVEAGKTYKLVIPKLDSNQYTAGFAFYNNTVGTAGHTLTLPSPAVVGPITNGEYNVTIPTTPTGLNHLCVCYAFSYGSPTVSFETITEGLKDDIDALDDRVSAIDLEIEDVKEDIDTLDSDMYGGEETVTLTPKATQQGVRMATGGAISSVGGDAYSLASYEVTPGQYKVFIPKLTNQYTLAFGFSSTGAMTAGNTVTEPSPVVVGPITDGTFDVTVPDGYPYLIVGYEHASGTATVTKTEEIAGVKADVAILKEKVDDIFQNTVEIILPNRYYAVVGDVLQIFRRGIIKAVNPYNYNVMFSCAKGSNFPRYWRVYPTQVSDAGTYPITVTVTDNFGKVMASATSELVILPSPISPASAKKIVCIGASDTFPGKWPSEAYRRLTGTGGTPSGKSLSNIAFCGPMTKDGAGYFGVGGWAWLNYISAGTPAFRFQVSGVDSLYLGATYTNNGHTYTVLEVNVTNGTGNILCSTGSSSNTPTASGTLTKATGDGDATIAFSSASADASNPFWNYNENKLDFQTFADSYCGGSIDCIIPMLGGNGRTKYETGFATLKENAKTFIDAFHAEFPSAKVLLLGFLCPSPIGGMGANYGSNQNYSDWYGMTVSMLNLKRAYQELANEDDYSSFVEFVDIAGQFDSDYNLPKEEQGVNIRNSEQKEWLGTNGLHPIDAGHGQIADAVYRAIVAKFCQS